VAWSAMFWPRLGPMAVEESKATRLAQQALRRLARPAFRLVLPEPVLAGVLADGLADPLGTVQALAAVGRQEPAALLLVDPAFARAMIRGQGRAAAFHPLVHQLWRDDAVRTIGEGRGWIDADFRIHDFRLALEESFADLAPRLRALRFDPVVRAAFRNPEVRHLYQVHDLPGLLGMAQVRAALGRVFGKVVDEGFGLERPEVVAPDKGGSEPERVRLPGGEFYRWTDESGREHYSNRPPGSGAGSGPSTTGEALRPATDRPATSPLLEPLDWPESIDDEDDDEEGETEVEHVPVRGGG